MTVECLTCAESRAEDDTVQLACSHSLCRECLRTAFQISMSSATFLPVRCCTAVPVKIFRDLASSAAGSPITPATLKTYRERTAEATVPAAHKLYCWKPECRAFIPPVLCDKRGGKCRECKTRTCRSCDSKAHYGACPKGKEVASAPMPRVSGELLLLALARRMRWKRCPQCKNLVEKNDGCNHIQ
ncbi:hypothetical protein GQ53DRAFT_829161 [Thozetella sp. PMI_491]|nr:hypothetical protein GQ53DRAFT_829161 [Thozetella sp. PMI_491]